MPFLCVQKIKQGEKFYQLEGMMKCDLGLSPHQGASNTTLMLNMSAPGKEAVGFF